jgi:hypothetical protein
MNSDESRQDGKVRSLRDLPDTIEPRRDLWPDIAARLAKEAAAAAPTRSRWTRWQTAGVAAGFAAAVVVGILIGRGTAPLLGRAGPTTIALTPAPAYIHDARYTHERAALLGTFNERLATLPPATRAKVLTSLQTIEHSIKDIQDALGRDPSNALLQELLVDTYQDEMRVLTTVDESAPPNATT